MQRLRQMRTRAYACVDGTHTLACVSAFMRGLQTCTQVLCTQAYVRAGKYAN